MVVHGINLSSLAIQEFCRKWKIRELSVFGSILRSDFRPDSDVDLLVQFTDGVDWEFEDVMSMESELEHIINRKVDLVDRESVLTSPNYIRCKQILGSAEPIYV